MTTKHFCAIVIQSVEGIFPYDQRYKICFRSFQCEQNSSKMNSGDFQNATKLVTFDMMQSMTSNGADLSESMIQRAITHTSVDGNYMCGLNAFRCCLRMKDYTKLPGKEDFPYTFPLIDMEMLRMGPRPADYAQWMQKWCLKLDAHIYHHSWDETIEFIKKHIREGNPVIALGSSGCLAHYFPIVGFGNGQIFVLKSNGKLLSASEDWLKYYMDVRIPTISGHSAFALVQ